jgi:hypothetical protein
VLPTLQALIAPLLAAVQARIMLTASLLIRRAVFIFAAALFGVGALMFLSVGIVFALSSSLGPGGATLVMAGIWAVIAVACLLISRPRPAAVAAATAPPIPGVIPPATAAAPQPPYPYPPYPSQPPYPPSSAVPPTSAATAPAAPASRLGRMRAGVTRAAPLLAIGALIAGIVAGRR